MASPKVDKIHLSGSTDGAPIAVVATASAGTTIHTAQAGATDGSYDEVWLWAINTSSTVAVKLTIEYGGTATVNQIEVTIEPEMGLELVVPGLILRNSLVIRAFGGTASAINIMGYVNRMTAGV